MWIQGGIKSILDTVPDNIMSVCLADKGFYEHGRKGEYLVLKNLSNIYPLRHNILSFFTLGIWNAIV